MNLRKKIGFFIAALITVVLFSCSKSSYNNGSTPPPGGGGNNGGATTLNIYNMAFPSSTTVKKGTIVKWYNQDPYAHTVTSDDGTTFDSGNLASGATFSYTANTAGTFKYHCKIHSGMSGTLTVTN